MAFNTSLPVVPIIADGAVYTYTPTVMDSFALMGFEPLFSQ